MTADGRTSGVAVVCARSSQASPQVKAYLETHGFIDARWYDPIGISNLDKAVRGGSITRVVFLDMASLFKAVWDEEIVFDAWLENNIRLDFVTEPEMSPGHLVGMVYREWQNWRRRHRRRQAIAGIVISAIVLGLAFLINVVVP